MHYGQRMTFETQSASDDAQRNMVVGSDDVAARSQPNHYVVTVRMVIYTA